MSKIECPGCGKKVFETAPACPYCGQQLYVENPGDIKGVRHPPIDIPPASPWTFGPKSVHRRVNERDTDDRSSD